MQGGWTGWQQIGSKMSAKRAGSLGRLDCRDGRVLSGVAGLVILVPRDRSDSNERGNELVRRRAFLEAAREFELRLVGPTR